MEQAEEKEAYKKCLSDFRIKFMVKTINSLSVCCRRTHSVGQLRRAKSLPEGRKGKIQFQFFIFVLLGSEGKEKSLLKIPIKLKK
jgi:hypothetical protein